MKLIVLTIGVVGLFAVSLFSFSYYSLASTVIASDHDQEGKSSQVDQTLQDQKQSTQEPDELIEEPDQEQEPSDQEEEIIEEEEEETVQIADPLYIWNKGMYYFNDKFYFWLLKPVTQGYSAVFPEGVRLSISNFYQNITTPIRFVNNLLQLKMKSAGNELLRLVLNTTFGVAGLGDFAKDKMDIKRHDEDLGQTFGHYGIGHGFYIVWPILGPSSLRDTVGYVGDLFLHPVSYITPIETAVGIDAHDKVNETSFHIGDYEDIIKAAVDPYISIRDAYVQHRKKKVEE
ncbi:MAG TPA: VacJ family lipoprotein [Thermodesulfovibrionales bacterium]|nr:VacJ family lipoprotein [Thermodesulfovibrionales bacterium]